MWRKTTFHYSDMFFFSIEFDVTKFGFIEKMLLLAGVATEEMIK